MKGETKPNVKFEKENRQIASFIGFVFFFYKPACSQNNFHSASAIHAGMFLTWVMIVHSDSSLIINTIASRDQFKPINIGETELADYNYFKLH